MTHLLEQAIEQARNMPTSAQGAIAALILDEIADDQCWDEAFAKSQPQMARLAEKVREDIRERRTRDVGMDEL